MTARNDSTMLALAVPVTAAMTPFPAVAEALGAPTGATEMTTGLVNSGTGAAIISIACLLLFALLFHASATRIAAFISARRGRRRLLKTLRHRSRNVLEDVIIPGAYGGLTRIDYLVLTSGGILCIRAKHCGGTVLGEDDDPQWKNVFGARKQKFLNPVIQNAGRTRALQNLVPEVPVASLVVFTGNAKLATPKSSNVIHVRELDSYIARFVFGPCKIRDWDDVWLTVGSAVLADEDSRKDFQAQLSFS